MSTDKLNTLTDAELSEVFAVEVAGWRVHARSPFRYDDDQGCPQHDDPVFATSADAVMPYLDRFHTWGFERIADAPGNVALRLVLRDEHYQALGKSMGNTTFARAACIALIRAKRARKTVDKP